MTRFKRSLQGKYCPAIAPTRKDKVPKWEPALHEGFAISVPHPSVGVPTETDANMARRGPEARPYTRGSLEQAMQFAQSPTACQTALLDESMASTKRRSRCSSAREESGRPNYVRPRAQGGDSQLQAEKQAKGFPMDQLWKIQGANPLANGRANASWQIRAVGSVVAPQGDRSLAG